MQTNNKPVDQFYYSEDEWARLGCGTLPPERDRTQLVDTNPDLPDTPMS